MSIMDKGMKTLASMMRVAVWATISAMPMAGGAQSWNITSPGGADKAALSADIAGVDFDKTAGTVTVKGLGGEWSDVYAKAIGGMTFAKPATARQGATLANSGVELTEADGWNESAYAKWSLMDGATSYNVYVKGGQYADYTLADKGLVRNYGTYGRADIVGP